MENLFFSHFILRKGLSLIELSLCLIISSLLLISVMGYYDNWMTKVSYYTAANQIKDVMKLSGRYFMDHKDENLSYNKYCVAAISDDLLLRKILRNSGGVDTINQKMKLYIKKYDCDSSTHPGGMFSLLLTLSGGKHMNIANANLLAGMIGYQGGVFCQTMNSYIGWKKGWSLNINSWGLEDDDFTAGAYSHFYPENRKNKVVLHSLYLIPYPAGMRSDKNYLVHKSSEDKINIIWNGAEIKKLTINISRDEGGKKNLSMGLLSHPYGGSYLLNLKDMLPESIKDETNLLFCIKAYGLNDNAYVEMSKEILIKNK